MTITTRDQLIDALGNNSDRFVFDKASLANAVAGQLFSLWQSAGASVAGLLCWRVLAPSPPPHNAAVQP